MRVVVAASIGWLALPVFGVQAAPRSAFEPNTGRWPMAVNFHAAASGLDLWITRDALVWSARAAEQSVALRWVFDDAPARDAAQLLDAARPLDARGEDAVCERRSHVRGAHACSTDTLWRRVRCVDVARGIDPVVRESAGALEYDLELAPGARLEDVADEKAVNPRRSQQTTDICNVCSSVALFRPRSLTSFATCGERKRAMNCARRPWVT